MDTVVTDFNTSHVSINRNRASGEWNHLHISIHLMFLLILYHISYRIPKNIISIHLMFLLIHNLTDTMVWWDVFQYISCFY